MADKRIIEQTASTTVPDDAFFIFDSALLGTFKISRSALLAFFGESGTQALTKITNAIADEYDSTLTYNKEDVVFYNNHLYRCISNSTTGTWDGTKWEEFDLPTALITTAHNIETAEYTIGTYYSADDLVLKDGKLYQCVVGHNATEWKSQFWRSVTIDEMLGYLSDSIAPEHNQSTVYAVGDLVMHNKILWRCIQAGAGAFVNANWEEVTVVSLIAEAGKIDDVQVKTTGDYETVVENKIAKIDLSSVTAYGSVPNLPQAIATFKDGADAPMKSLKVAIEPQQEGSGDPSPTNVRPISGWDEVDVTRTGKNLVDWKWNTFNDGKMEIFLKGGTYTLSAESALTNGNAYIRGIKPSGEYCTKQELGLSGWSNSSTSGVYYGGGGQQTYTFNVPNGGAKIEFGKLNNNGTINAQLEIGSTATSYEPYNGQTITIQLGGTRYGGEVDVVNGVLTVDKVCVVYDGSADENWFKYGSGSASAFAMCSNNALLSNINAIPMASYLKGISRNETWGNYDNWVSVTSGDRLVTGMQSITEVEDWKTYLSSNNLQVVYELATPQTIQLTPTQVKSLRGVNNVYANTGNVNKCVYRRDMTSTIDDIIARLEALENA